MKLRLSAVLDLRLAAEEAAKRELGRLERERSELVVRRGSHIADIEQAGRSPVPARMREVLSAFILAARRAVAELDGRIAEQDGRIAAARSALAQAHREVKAIEAIRARDAAQAARIALRREARANDEHAARIRMEALA